MLRWKSGLLLVSLLLLAACSPAVSEPGPADGSLAVVATTTLIADVVRVVGGDAVSLTILLPAGSDPHRFDPSPAEARAVADAQVVFMNGLGLEIYMEDLVLESGSTAEVVVVSDGIEPLGLADSGEEDAHAGEEDHSHEGGFDPHVWMDPNNVIIWTRNIAAALSEADPDRAALFEANAAAYIQELEELDLWIAAQVEPLTPDQRGLVVDHDSLSYFARRYGFTLVGFVVPGYSTLAQPSAQELAELIDQIRSFEVRAIFVDPSFSPALAESVAADAGVQIVTLYTASLTPEDGPAATYLDLMRTNTTAIVDALSARR